METIDRTSTIKTRTTGQVSLEPNRPEMHPHKQNQSDSIRSHGVESQVIAKTRQERRRLRMVRLKLSR